MKDAQKPDHVSLNTLISYLRDGRFVIPDFQREFEWKPWDVRDLMRSIFLDYYIGSLLLWKGKPDNFAALSCERLYGRGTGNQSILFSMVSSASPQFTTLFSHRINPSQIGGTDFSSLSTSINSCLRHTMKHSATNG